MDGNPAVQCETKEEYGWNAEKKRWVKLVVYKGKELLVGCPNRRGTFQPIHNAMWDGWEKGGPE